MPLSDRDLGPMPSSSRSSPDSRWSFSRLLGGLAAYVGGANMLWGALRVTFWGALAMAATAAVGALFGTTV